MATGCLQGTTTSLCGWLGRSRWGRGGGNGQLSALVAAHPVTSCGVTCLVLAGFVLYAFHCDWETRKAWLRADEGVRWLIAGSLGVCGWGLLMVIAGVVSGR